VFFKQKSKVKIMKRKQLETELLNREMRLDDCNQIFAIQVKEKESLNKFNQLLMLQNTKLIAELKKRDDTISYDKQLIETYEIEFNRMKSEL